MAHPSTVKKQVRERDNQQCCECGMTAEEHRRRFGKNLHVHRTEYFGHFSLGTYEIDKCETLCTLCHKAKHNFYDSIRRRDGWACTKCGMSDEDTGCCTNAPCQFIAREKASAMHAAMQRNRRGQVKR
jgi:hypothetical protein